MHSQVYVLEESRFRLTEPVSCANRCATTTSPRTQSAIDAAEALSHSFEELDRRWHEMPESEQEEMIDSAVTLYIYKRGSLKQKKRLHVLAGWAPYVE